MPQEIDGLDLSPLSALQHLAKVALRRGNPYHLHTAGLKKLEMLSSYVVSVHFEARKRSLLQKLVMCSARLNGSHGLKSMPLCDAFINADQMGIWCGQLGFSGRATSALSCLRHLQMSPAGTKLPVGKHKLASLCNLHLQTH